MDAEELVDKYLAEKVNRTEYETEDWQSYMDPFTGRTVWYDQQLDWDYFGSNDKPLTYTKSPFEPQEIP